MYALITGFSDRDQINVNEILRFAPNLKVLKLRETERHPDSTCPTPIIGVEIFREPLEKENCSALEELGLLVFRKRYWGRISENKDMGIEELNRYIEEVNPSLKRIQIEVDFDRRMEENKGMGCPYPHFHQFCIRSGHLLTELKINVRKPHNVPMDTCWNVYADPNSPDNPSKKYRYGDYNRGEWVNYLTGYSFPNLTKLTYTFSFKCQDCDDDAGFSPFFDFSSLKGMPKLKSFRCIDMTRRTNYFGKNPHPFFHEITNRHLADAKRMYFWMKREGELEEGVPDSLQLENLEEFVYDSVKDGFTMESLKTVLGLMKGVKKLKLCLDEITFPLVLEMLPDLEELTLIGNQVDLTELEKKTGIVWMEKDELIRRRKIAYQKREKDKEAAPSSPVLPVRPVSTKEYITKDVDDFAIFGALRTRKKLRIFNTGDVEEDDWAPKRLLIEYRLK